MNRDKIKALLKDYTYSDYKSLHDKYRAWLTGEKVDPDTYFPNRAGEIAVFQFRCNEPISFNDEERNNDLLVLLELTDGEQSIRDYFLDTTCDPKAKAPGIAHTCAQIYRGNVGAHRGFIERTCIRSDFGLGTRYNRTDSEGEVKDLNPSDEFTSVYGHIGINIHNANGCYNSSLGCTIFSSEGAYQKIFKPVIKGCSNKSNIMVALIDADDFNDILGLAPDAAIPEIKPEDNVNP